jgi:hypothetical protein
MIRGLLLSALLALLSACGSTPETPGTKIQVHTQLSAALQGCSRFGPVRSTVPRRLFVNSWPALESDLREQTAKLGGDTLVLLQLDEATNTRHGMALKCY